MSMGPAMADAERSATGRAKANASLGRLRLVGAGVPQEGIDGVARFDGVGADTGLDGVGTDTRLDVHARMEAARADVEANVKRLAECRSRLAATRVELADGRTVRQQLHDSVFARLQARLESLPVIEQAKGVLMARTGCQPDEAFDILRRASQRTNVKVRDLAQDVVNRASGGGKSVRPAGVDPASRTDESSL
jgi:hypothetical protein